MIKLDEVRYVKFNPAKLTRIALATAFIAVGAQLAIPTIPAITMQTLCIFVSAIILTPIEAVLASLVYLLLGAVGVPVFSGFCGGFGVILSVSGGFLLSFPLIAYGVSYFSKKFQGTVFTHAFTFTLATLVSYILGAIWIAIMNYYDGTFGKMLSTCVLPFIPFDAIKIALAILCAMKLEKVLKNGKKKNQNNRA